MTDKERYEAAMEENHRLREELKNWKEAFNALVIDGKEQQEDYRKISELYIKEQQKNGELEMTNTQLANECIKMKISTAHALSRWAQATKIWYKLKGYSGLAERYQKIHSHFFEVYNKLKPTKKP